MVGSASEAGPEAGRSVEHPDPCRYFLRPPWRAAGRSVAGNAPTGLFLRRAARGGSVGRGEGGWRVQIWA